eukprot:5510257-Amphidinium_carterae.1
MQSVTLTPAHAEGNPTKSRAINNTSYVSMKPRAEKQKKVNQYHTEQKESKKFQQHRYTPKYWTNEQNGVYQKFSSFISSNTFVVSGTVP